MSSYSSRRRRRRRTFGPIAVAILDLRLGGDGLVVVVVVVVLLGEAEVHERAVPGVPEAHLVFACSPGRAGFPADARDSRRSRSSLIVQARADSHDCRALLRRRRGSPARCPSRARARPCSAASSRSAANHGRLASGSAASGGIVISPATGSGDARDVVADLLRRDPGLALLAGDVDLQQHAQARLRALGVARAAGASAEREASEWISVTCGTIALAPCGSAAGR